MPLKHQKPRTTNPVPQSNISRKKRMNSRSPLRPVPFSAFSFGRLARLGLHLIVGFFAVGILCSAAPRAAAAQPTHTIGEQRTLVLLVNFLDSANEMPFTTTQASDAIFGTVGDFVYEASYGQTWLSGDVYGWFTLPFNSTCTSYVIGDAADDAASDAGIDLSTYTRFIYILKGATDCYWAGTSSVGLYPSRAWINGTLDTQVIAHELAHGFGLYHSNFLDCASTTLGLNCSTAKDDKFDTMGSSTGLGHFNAFQKENLGWFSPGDIVTVTADGTHTLQPYELSGDGAYPKVIKVLKESDPQTGGSVWYYLEYRQAIGFDGFIAGNENVLNGVLVHTGADFNGESSLLLDMTPASQPLTFADRSDPALVVGQSFHDPASGLTITTDSADESGATVSISFGETACVQAKPALAASPSVSGTVKAGTPVTYSVTVTNTANTACADASFGLSAVVPQGWTAAFNNNLLTLAPGASATITLTVTSSSSAPGGTYGVAVTVKNSANPVYAASAVVNYAVSSVAVNSAPVAVDDSAKTLLGTAVSIDVLANDSDLEHDPLRVIQVTQGSSGAVVINADSTVTYTPGPRAKNSDSFTYTVSDGHSSSRATVSVLFQKQSTGGGKGKVSTR